MNRRTLATLAAAAALAALGPVAHAQDEAKPSPCGSLLFGDPTGDAGSLGVLPAADNLDLKGAFIRTDGDITTANIVVAELTRDVAPTVLFGHDWLLFYSAGDAVRFVRAFNNGAEVVYEFGTDDPTQGLTIDGTTAGAFFEGPDGVVQIEIPLPAIPEDGILRDVFATTADDQGAVLLYADSAPDEQGAQEIAHTVAPCAGATGEPVAAPAPPASPPPAPALERLPLTVAAKAGSARRARRAGRVALRVRAGRDITRLSATLRKGSKVVAGGTRRRVGRGALTLNLRLRRGARLSRGTYTLRATGTVDGRRLTVSRRVRLAS